VHRIGFKNIQTFFSEHGFELTIFIIVIFLYLIMKYLIALQYTYLTVPIILAAFYYHRYRGRLGILGKALLAILIISLIISGLYLYTSYDRLVYTLNYTNLDLLVASIILLLTLNYVRIVHKVLFFIIIALFIYDLPYVGRLLPEPFFHLGLPWIRYITSNTIETAGGLASVFGTLAIIGLEIIAPILFLLAFMESFGILGSIGRIIISFIRRATLIPLSNPILSSSIGTVTGSIASDTAVTGSVTIPLMKRIGIPPEWAGTIAAVSGITAYIMPPIMGTVAFIMPSFLGVSYWDVVVRAFFIAIAYVLATMLLIYMVSRIYVGSGQNRGVEVGRGEISYVDYANFAGFIMCIAILIILIGVAGYELPTAVYYTLIAFTLYFIPLHIAYRVARGSGFKQIAKDLLTNVLRGVDGGARSTIDVVLLLASLGIMVNMITAVGLIQDFNWLVLGITGESLWLLVAITYFFGFLMGLALPAVATYISIAVLLVPAMVSLGIDKWAAHFFAFYLAAISEFTPPTSISAIVAAGIAGAEATKIMGRMFILGMPIYILPIIILINPQILTPSPEAMLISYIIFSTAFGLTTPALIAMLRISIGLRGLIALPISTALAITALIATPIYAKVLLATAILIINIYIIRSIKRPSN
jgi:TRAP transporter 4TM/12TM fusion protein